MTAFSAWVRLRAVRQAIGFFFFSWALFLFVLPNVFAQSSDDPADVVDRERVYLDQVMHTIERQRAEQEDKKKSEMARLARLKKKREEIRLAEQLKGLSGTLSGLPELPNFNGKFETQKSEISGQLSGSQKKSKDSES